MSPAAIPVAAARGGGDTSVVMPTARPDVDFGFRADTDGDERRFVAGTTGWCADDLDDPDFEAQWEAGAFEIADGVLTQMPAARIDDGNAFVKLIARLQSHLDAVDDGGKLSLETDVILGSMRVPRVDAVYLAAGLLPAQEAAHAASHKPRGRYGRVRVAPTLVIENVSLGHEAHDRVTKRRWYAEAGVGHYWLLDAYGKTLETLVLDGTVYHTEQLGRAGDVVRPSLFPGLAIPLTKVWA